MPDTIPATADVMQISQLLQNGSGARLIDVRTEAEFNQAHIPGSRHLPLSTLRKNVAELASTPQDHLVLVCAGGARAEQARQLLQTAGFSRLTVLRGGLNAWEQSEAPLHRGSSNWTMERQVRLVAGMLVLIGVLSSLAFEPLKWIAGFVGAGLTFAALSNTCAMAKVLSLLPHNHARRCDC
ncbi:rhodanese-related sulfurtransferase [Saccharomonospora amisosensis]|uniref:Rhodanese-related sulfurtransferase n=1 Tax=Saccharomonospora amisosensis TaxID=1128677 RepID=A0A7X5ZRY7_9PSEU|nr:rhodanese-like domain-containing protein [Saccharomonospora amisosensis]NIJ13362.1 rhodanese-related sulfurtransferase [Saccharomonospora amisosensis]